MTCRRAIVMAAGILGMAACCGPIRADMGAIPFTSYKYVDVFEPDQRAVIAWNGKEEILILSTDLQVSRETKVLEVIPMPSEPNVTQGDVRVFRTAVEVLNSKLPKKRVRAGPAGETLGKEGGGGDKEVEEPPVAEITFHQKIGATDVSVVHVLSQAGFIEWVEKYLKTQSVESPSIPDIMKKTVQEYLDDGYDWFAFNVVSLNTEILSKQAVQYRFKTDSLFYPMRISRTGKGSTHVSLTVLTNQPFDNLTVTGVPEGRVSLAYDIVTVDAGEVEKISRECFALLGRPATARLRVWETKGQLSSFDEDIVGGRERAFTLRHQKSGESFGPFPLRRDAKISMGKEVFTLMVQQEQKGKPTQFVLRREKIVEKSAPFLFAQGEKVVLAGEPFILQAGKPPVARDPAKAANNKAVSAGPDGKP